VVEGSRDPVRRGQVLDYGQEVGHVPSHEHERQHRAIQRPDLGISSVGGKGCEVIVCRRNVPLARVEAIRKPQRNKSKQGVVGCMKGNVEIHGDLTEPCIPGTDWDILH